MSFACASAHQTNLTYDKDDDHLSMIKKKTLQVKWKKNKKKNSSCNNSNNRHWWVDSPIK